MALDFTDLLPEGLQPYGFQTVGAGYALVAKRTFIADEMGLGKTIQAIVTLLAADTFPAVVACPASLKGNWKREINKWAPHLKVEIVSGRKVLRSEAQVAERADVVVVNYDILKAWEPFLSPKALVLDESHYCKESKAQRTQAATALAAKVPAEGVVLALTGTPLLNRPVELIAQLRILGALEKVAPRPRRGTSDRDWEFSFKFAYCGPEQENGYWTFKGASNTAELNERLRRTCYVRRLRADVLDMTDTVRMPLVLSLNGALKDYRRAEADLISFLRQEKGDAAAAKARRAEVLVGLNTLRTLAGLAKIEAAGEWVKNFFEENPDKSLVVFAHHIAVQQALLAQFADLNPARILGGQANAFTEAEKARFQNGETRLIVCSLKAAREGHTLTAAHDVLFVEQGWTPGEHQQAEDRCNRIGQTAQYVFAHYLLAEETVDEFVHELIESKRAIFNAVADGDFDAEDENVVNAVIDHLKGKGAR